MCTIFYTNYIETYAVAASAVFCTQDVFDCGDDTFVGRDPQNNCEFEPCPNCLLSMEVGPCRDSFKRFYYDPAKQKCRKFFYGGCGGNPNNFEKKSDCKEKCERNA